MAHRRFDEIMIVNPVNHKGGKRMRFYRVDPASLSGYVAADPVAYGDAAPVGYVSEDELYEYPEAVGYVAEDELYEYPEAVGYVAEDEVYEYPETVGYVAEEPYEMGYVADPPPGFTEGFGHASAGVAYVAEVPAYDYPETVGYVAEDPDDVEHDDSDEMGDFAEDPEEMAYDDDSDEMGYFAQDPDEDMADDDDSDEMGHFAQDSDEMVYDDDSDEMGYFAEDADAVEGYVRETAEHPFNTRCVPVNKLNGVEGYERPKTINPTVQSFREPETKTESESGWFNPLW